jgi:hypothetical protein
MVMPAINSVIVLIQILSMLRHWRPLLSLILFASNLFARFLGA